MVVIVGQGYVGLPLAMRAVEAGFSVVGYDTDEDRIKRLAAGESYVEDITTEALAAALASGRYRPSSQAGDCAGFDVAVVTVPTPLREGNPDLSYIESAAALLAPHLRAEPRWCWSPPPIQAPPKSCSAPSSRRDRAWPPVATSTWATAPSASIPATRCGA
jgi:UDP-glucose 6-dehydrogenase